MKNKRWLLWWKTALIVFAGIFVMALVNYSSNFTGAMKILTKESVWLALKDFCSIDNVWLALKVIIFFFAFVFFCHGPLVWMGILFSIKDGKGRLIYSKDRILTLKITYHRRHLDKSGKVVDDINKFTKPFKWFINYFFGSLHVLGIPGIHKIDTETYDWEKLNPLTGEAEPAKNFKGEFPLREFIPIINFQNLDVVGGQINVKIGPLIKITIPMKTATVARDWFPFLIDMLRGHIRECFAPLDFFRVMISKKKFGQTDKDGKLLEKTAQDLSAEILDYFNKKKVEDIVNGKKTKFPLIEFIERKYGIKIIKFYVMDPDPVDASKELLNAISKPEKAKLDAKELVIKAGAEADSFGKAREAMEKPGGELLRKLQALEKSSLVTLGDGKNLNLFVDTSKQKKGGGTSGNP